MQLLKYMKLLTAQYQRGKKTSRDLALLRNLIITHIECGVYRICKLPLFSNIFAAAGGVMPRTCKRPSKHTFEDEKRPLQVIYGGHLFVISRTQALCVCHC